VVQPPFHSCGACNCCGSADAGEIREADASLGHFFCGIIVSGIINAGDEVVEFVIDATGSRCEHDK